MQHPGSADSRWIDLYVTGRLSATDEATFEEHLLECAACREEVESAEGLRRELREVTAEEVWQSRFPSEDGSVHFLVWPELPALPGDDAISTNWADVRALREQVTEAIEPLRREKVIRSSLEAEVTVPSLPLDADALAEVFIVAKVRHGDAIGVTRTDYHKCGRCWRLLPEVTEDGALCDRCAEVVA